MTNQITHSEQQEAIFSAFADPDSGHLVIQARAGTGKTYTCLEGIRRAPEKTKGYVVFNKRNQGEAQAKLGARNTEALTLNALGYRYVKAEWFGVRPDDDVEGDRLDQVIATDPTFSQLGSKYRPTGVIMKLVGFAKNTIPRMPTSDDLNRIADRLGLDVDGYPAQLGWNMDLAVEAALGVLELSRTKDPKGRISFNDQLWLPVVMGWVRRRFDLLAVDEAQDLNPVQIEMVLKACRGRIVLIGDARQAIYQFRGADVTGMARMKTQLKAKELFLTRTYRCPRLVVELARGLVPDYQCAPDAPDGISRQVASLDEMEHQLQPGDAVVSRINAPLAGTCLRLIRKGVPAYIEGRDFGKEISALVSEIGKNASGVEDFLARLDRWEERKMKRLGSDEAAERKAALITDQADTIRAFADAAASVREIGQRIYDLFQDSAGVKRPSVVLSSTHKAKGLEWRRVFVLMSTYRVRTATTVESEEANLTYVAWTRAMHELVRVNGDWRAKAEVQAPEKMMQAGLDEAEAEPTCAEGETRAEAAEETLDRSFRAVPDCLRDNLDDGS